MDACELNEGIIGYRGFTTLLERPLLFCSSRCLKNYIDDKERNVYKLNRKIP